MYAGEKLSSKNKPTGRESGRHVEREYTQYEHMNDKNPAKTEQNRTAGSV